MGGAGATPAAPATPVPSDRLRALPGTGWIAEIGGLLWRWGRRAGHSDARETTLTAAAPGTAAAIAGGAAAALAAAAVPSDPAPFDVAAAGGTSASRGTVRCSASGWHVRLGCTDGDGGLICPLCSQRVQSRADALVPSVRVVLEHGT